MATKGFAMSKRDFYEILEVSKSATAEEIKKLTERKLYSTTPIKIPGINSLKRNSKRLQKHTKYLAILKSASAMTSLDIRE